MCTCAINYFHCRCLTAGRTDGKTDGRTDGRNTGCFLLHFYIFYSEIFRLSACKCIFLTSPLVRACVRACVRVCVCVWASGADSFIPPFLRFHMLVWGKIYVLVAVVVVAGAGWRRRRSVQSASSIHMTYRRKAPVCTDFVSAVCSVWSDPLRVIAQFLCLQDTRSGDDGGSGGIIRLKQGDHTWVGVGTGGD